jgi:SAM-dependent methyltransferase
MSAATSTGRPRPDIASVARLAELADYITPFALRTVCALDVADALAGGPLPLTALAAVVGADPGALRRVLRVLTHKGIFTETPPDTFGLSPLAEPLRTDHPLSVRDTYALLASDVRAWAHLDHSVRTGEAAFAQAHGEDYWSYLGWHPDDSAAADRWMEGASRLHARTLLGAYPWRELSTVVDVGGGTGAFLAALLRRCPDLRGVLFDLPYVVVGAPDVLAKAGVADRCEVVGGSFFDGVPPGADAYLLKTVLPGFDDDAAMTALRAIRNAMRPDSRLLALEAILPPGNAYDVAKLFDVHTLVLTGGAHRTREHLADLFARCGLRLDRVLPSPTLTILEARPSVESLAVAETHPYEAEA